MSMGLRRVVSNARANRAVAAAATAGCLVAGAVGLADARTLGRPADRRPATRSAAAADLAAAKDQWIASQLLSGGAAQAVPLALVVADLRRAVKAGASRTGYGREIALVVRFGELPDAMLTPAQEAQFTADFAAIDRFFAIRKNPWTGGCLSHGPGIRAAIKDWDQEPANAHHGVTKAPLVAAATVLARASTTDTGDRSCYPAAIADLDAIQDATSAQVAATPVLTTATFANPTAVQVVAAEIFWLNTWFNLQNGGLTSVSRL